MRLCTHAACRSYGFDGMELEGLVRASCTPRVSLEVGKNLREMVLLRTVCGRAADSGTWDSDSFSRRSDKATLDYA